MFNIASDGTRKNEHNDLIGRLEREREKKNEQGVLRKG